MSTSYKHGANHIISFPHMGDYAVPVQFLLSHITTMKIQIAPPITARTIELGSKYSPEFVCTPFKYTIGTLLESLEMGADILLQAGGGCRYGYYSELQEEILKEQGYSFMLFNLVSAGKTDIKKIYRLIKKIEPHFHLLKSLYYLKVTMKMVHYMDEIDHYIRANIGFECHKNEFLDCKKEMLEAFSKIKNNRELRNVYHYYWKRFLKIELKKPQNCLKIGVIGELYTLMEPFANYQLEYVLASYHMEVKRYTNVTYLLFQKKQAIKRYLKKNKKYVTYQMGADAADNVCRARYLCEHGYDGIIHIKSSFCTPEIGAMPLITKVCQDYQVPVIYFSFDANTSEVGMKTRLEAFYDMLEMRRNK